MRGVGSQIVSGIRYRFPDHEFVGGPWTDDELATHMFDSHGGIYTSKLADHFTAHVGYKVDRLFVKARSREEVRNYCGFGAEVVASNPLPASEVVGMVKVEVVVDVPVYYTRWLSDRLASGLLFARQEYIIDAPEQEEPQNEDAHLEAAYEDTVSGAPEEWD